MYDDVLGCDRAGIHERQFRLLLSSAYRNAWLEFYRNTGREPLPGFVASVNRIAAVGRIRVLDALQIFAVRTFARTYRNLCDVLSMSSDDIVRDYWEFCQKQLPTWVDVDCSAFYRYAYLRFGSAEKSYQRMAAAEYLTGYLAGRCDAGVLGLQEFGFAAGTDVCEAFMLRLLGNELAEMCGSSKADGWVGVIAGKLEEPGAILWGTVPADWIPETSGQMIFPCPSVVLEMVRERSCSESIV